MGVQLISTVLVPAPPPAAPASVYDLTDLASVHDELQIKHGNTTDDSWLSRAISQASTQIRIYVKRPFQIETVQDQVYLTPDPWPRQEPLELSRWPLTGITTLTTTADTPSGSVLPFASTTGVAAGQQVSGVAFAPNTQTQPIATGAIVQSVAPGTSVTLSAPIAADIPAGTAVTFGLSVVQLQSNMTRKLLAAGSEFQIDAAHGQLVRLNPYTGWAVNWEAWPLTVIYSAGYAQGIADLPADVTDAVLRLVTERWHLRGRDPSVKSQEQPGALGTTVWWVGGPPKTGVLPLEIEGILDQYRVPSIA